MRSVQYGNVCMYSMAVVGEIASEGSEVKFSTVVKEEKVMREV